MTSRANYAAGQDFDRDERGKEVLEMSAGKQLLSAVRLAAWHARRTVIFVPVFGVVFLAIGFMWIQGLQAESTLNARSKQLSILLDQPAPQPEDLLRQADGWDAAYRVVMAERVARPADSELIARVIKAAADSGVLITETGTTLDSEATIENESYTATPVLISAIGTMESIKAYLQLLETSEFASFGIEAANIEEGLAGYQLTLRGLFYSLPEDFGEVDPAVDAEIAVTPIVPVDEGGDE